MPRWRIDVCAVDRDGLGYGSSVLTTVDQDAREDYERAAREIVRSGADVVVVEHEFGIFGGPAGGYVLDLVDGLRAAGVPYVVTLQRSGRIRRCRRPRYWRRCAAMPRL